MSVWKLVFEKCSVSFLTLHLISVSPDIYKQPYLRLLSDPWFLNLSEKRVTVSKVSWLGRPGAFLP